MLTQIERLKIELITHGLRVSGTARQELSGRGENRPITLADYASTSGISMRLEGHVWVNAPIADHNPNFVQHPACSLDFVEDRFVVRSGLLEAAAEPVPVPDWHNQTNLWGEPYTSYAITHTDRVRISPIEGCGIVCKYCDLPYEYRYRTKRVEGLVDSIRHAVEDRRVPAKHVLISGGTPRPNDYVYENEAYEAVARAFPHLDIDIMMVPCPGLLDVEHLRQIGIHGLSINLELHNEQLARKIMPAKARLGRQHFLDFIETAVETFGSGRIRSLLLVGLEPLEDTLCAVAALAERGCEPVLSPFRPDPATPLRKLSPPSVDLLVEIYERGREITEKHGVKLGPRCIPCHHNTLTFPDGSPSYYYSHPRQAVSGAGTE